MGFLKADEYMKVTITKDVPNEKHDAMRSVVSRDLS